MQLLRLRSHRGEAVEAQVEHCAPCRLVWFDALESVALHAQGWVTLLRAMEAGAQLPLPHEQRGRWGCLHCEQPLRAVRNQTRYGRFGVMECPQRHGHLHTQAGLLAERGLVRPLGAPERQALRDRQLTLRCFHCGAPATASDDDCAFCHQPLMVVDLPRLQHALQPPQQAHADSPQAVGALASWSCRGCGAALDAGRDAACSRCGLPVLLDRLPDLGPLLDAAQQALDAAAARASRAAAAVAGAAVRAVRAVEEVHDPLVAARSWGPGALLSLLFGALLMAGLLLADLVPLGESPMQRWRLQRVAPGLSASAALLATYPGDDPARLQERLFALHLRLASRGTPVDGLRAGPLLDGELARFPARPDVNDAMALLNRELRPATTPNALPRPEPLADDRWFEAAPGVWIAFQRRDRALWWLEVQNHGAVPRWVGSLDLDLRGPEPNQRVPWRCRSNGDAAAGGDWLAPGAIGLLRCESRVPPSAQEEVWLTTMDGLRQSQAPVLHWTDESWRRGAGAKRDQAAWLRVATAAPAVRAPAPSLAAHWKTLTPRRQIAVGLALTVAAWPLFVLLLRGLGRRRGFLAWWFALLPLCWLLGRGEGAASVLLVGSYWMLIALLGAGFLFVGRVLRGGP
jgi:hypothetical protein